MSFISDASKFETKGLAAIELRKDGDLEGLFKKLGCLVLFSELRILNFVLLSIETGVPNFRKLFGNDRIYVY